MELGKACRCLALRHACYSNCKQCGIIFCVEDEAIVRSGGCYVCLSGGTIEPPPSAAEARVSLSEAEAKAYELKDRLLQYDLENAKRTHVFDAQADYYETSVWLTDAEKEAIDSKQQKRREQMLPSSRRTVLTLSLGGGIPSASQSFFSTAAGPAEEPVEVVDEKFEGNDGSPEFSVVVNESLANNKNPCGGVYRLLLEQKRPPGISSATYS